MSALRTVSPKGLIVILGVAAFLLVGASVGAVHADDHLPPQPEALDGAVQAVRSMVQQGRSREEIGTWLAEKIDNRVTNMNSWERMSLWENWIPFVRPSMRRNEDFSDWRNQQNYDYEDTAKWTWQNRIGQCSENANLTSYILVC